MGSNRSMTDIIAYYRELKVKTNIEKLRLNRYILQRDSIDQINEAVRYKEAKIKVDVQENLLGKLNEHYLKFASVIDNIANTLGDRDAKMFVLIFVKNLKVKEVANVVGLSSSTVWHKKYEFEKMIQDTKLNPIKL